MLVNFLIILRNNNLLFVKKRKKNTKNFIQLFVRKTILNNGGHEKRNKSVFSTLGSPDSFQYNRITQKTLLAAQQNKERKKKKVWWTSFPYITVRIKSRERDTVKAANVGPPLLVEKFKRQFAKLLRATVGQKDNSPVEYFRISNGQPVNFSQKPMGKGREGVLRIAQNVVEFGWLARYRFFFVVGNSIASVRSVFFFFLSLSLFLPLNCFNWIGVRGARVGASESSLRICARIRKAHTHTRSTRWRFERVRRVGVLNR